MKEKHILRDSSLEFAIAVIKFTQELPNRQPYWVIIDQLIRSGTSIGANIFEARSASSRRDFIKYYEIALKSANETIYWIIVLKRINNTYINHVEELDQKVRDITRILASSIKTLKKL